MNEDKRLNSRIAATTENSVLYAINLNQTDWHKNRVPCIIIGEKNPIAIETAGEWIKGNALLVTPDYNHRVHFGSQGSYILYLEHLEIPVLEGIGGCCAVALSDHESLALAQALGNWSEDWELEFRASLFDRSTTKNLPQVLTNVLKMIDDDPLFRIGQKQLSEILGIERTRALRAFKSYTGMTLRSYQIWKSLRAAISDASLGATLQTAGLDNGFSDAAHFSRTFRNSFGIAPSSTLKTGNAF